MLRWGCGEVPVNVQGDYLEACGNDGLMLKHIVVEVHRDAKMFQHVRMGEGIMLKHLMIRQQWC